MNIIETKNLTKGSDAAMRVSDLDLAIPEGCVYGSWSERRGQNDDIKTAARAA